MVETPVRYAGFWARLKSGLLDIVILLPLSALGVWGSSHYRLFSAYYFAPGIFVGLFYSVVLVRRYGGTPGKLLVGIRIRKLNGEPVGYREASLRYSVDFVLGSLAAIALLVPLFRMTDAEYFGLSIMQRAQHIVALAPHWAQRLQRAQAIWVLSELVVLLTNRKRRALHDFIGGTVVVHTSRNEAPGMLITDPSVST